MPEIAIYRTLETVLRVAMFEMHGDSCYWQTAPPGMFVVPLIQETVKSQAVECLSAGVCRRGPNLAAQSSVNR